MTAFDEHNENNNSANNNNSGLIVNFPDQSREARRSGYKTVRFWNRSQLHVFRRPTARDNEAKSYNASDYEYFKRLRSHDVVRCSDMIMEKKSKGEALTIVEACLFRGLELLLSPDIVTRFRQVVEERKAHIKNILEEQKHQREKGESNPVAIARVSVRSSMRARRRAYTVAAAAFGASVKAGGT
jgi:hypothetical protein